MRHCSSRSSIGRVSVQVSATIFFSGIFVVRYASYDREATKRRLCSKISYSRDMIGLPF